MIFDADTHISPYGGRSFAHISAETLVESMAKCGVDGALCWLSPHGVADVSPSNRYLYESGKKYPQLMPFGWANVGEGVDKAVKDAETCISEYGFVGVKLNGAQNEYPIDGNDALTVCEKIATLGGIIAFHIGVDSPDNTSPYRAAVVAEKFPETTILMVHMGGAGKPDCSEDVIKVAKNHPNMVLIASSIATYSILDGIDQMGPERILFGSDMPFDPIDVEKARFDTLLKRYDQHTYDLIMGENAKRVFGL